LDKKFKQISVDFGELPLCILTIIDGLVDAIHTLSCDEFVEKKREQGIKIRPQNNKKSI
jgi:hypothetical protein